MQWFLKELRKLLNKLMVFFNDQVDDQLAFETSQSFEGGMVSNARANTLQANQSALIQNYDLTKFGELTARRGTARVGGTTVSGSNAVLRMTRFSTAAGIEQLVASVYDASF